MNTIEEMDDQELLAAIKEQGGQTGLAQELGITADKVRWQLQRRGLISSSRKGARPPVTRESLAVALTPPNNCRVKRFLEELEQDSRCVVEEALGYAKEDFSAAALRTWLLELGFNESDVPGVSAITDHRSGRRPCRCRG